MSDIVTKLDNTEEPLLRLEDLSIDYRIRNGYLSAVSDVNFTMNRGDVVLSNMDLTGCHISTDQALVPSTLILLPIDYVLQNMKDEPEVIRVY